MSESTWTQAFLKDLRREMPKAEIIKNNSYGGMVEGGIPDVVICVRDQGRATSRTGWIEVKILPSKNQMFKPLQLERLRRMGGWYLVWHTVEKRGWLFRADEAHCWADGPRHTREELLQTVRRFF